MYRSKNDCLSCSKSMEVNSQQPRPHINSELSSQYLGLGRLQKDRRHPLRLQAASIAFGGVPRKEDRCQLMSVCGSRLQNVWSRSFVANFIQPPTSRPPFIKSATGTVDFFR